MNFLASFVQFLVLIPAALLCYLPPAQQDFLDSYIYFSFLLPHGF